MDAPSQVRYFLLSPYPLQKITTPPLHVLKFVSSYYLAKRAWKRVVLSVLSNIVSTWEIQEPKLICSSLQCMRPKLKPSEWECTPASSESYQLALHLLWENFSSWAIQIDSIFCGALFELFAKNKWSQGWFHRTKTSSETGSTKIQTAETTQLIRILFGLYFHVIIGYI